MLSSGLFTNRIRHFDVALFEVLSRTAQVLHKAEPDLSLQSQVTLTLSIVPSSDARNNLSGETWVDQCTKRPQSNPSAYQAHSEALQINPDLLRYQARCLALTCTATWVWVKIEPPGDHRFGSMFALTRARPTTTCLAVVVLGPSDISCQAWPRRPGEGGGFILDCYWGGSLDFNLLVEIKLGFPY